MCMGRIPNIYTYTDIRIHVYTCIDCISYTASDLYLQLPTSRTKFRRTFSLKAGRLENFGYVQFPASNLGFLIVDFFYCAMYNMSYDENFLIHR